MRSIRFALALAVMAAVPSESQARSSPSVENVMTPKPSVVMDLRASPEFDLGYINLKNVVSKTVLLAGIGTMDASVAIATAVEAANVLERSDQTEASTKSTSAETSYASSLVINSKTNRGAGVLHRLRPSTTSVSMTGHRVQTRLFAALRGGRGFL